MSHVSPAFAPVFGNCIKLLRKVLYTESGQPFLVAGSGTLGWDAVAANLVENGEKAVSPGSGFRALRNGQAERSWGMFVVGLEHRLLWGSLCRLSVALRGRGHSAWRSSGRCPYVSVVFTTSPYRMTKLKCDVSCSKEQIAEALKKDKYKVLTFTHGKRVSSDRISVLALI